MLIYASLLSAESEQRRAALLADAENYRLTRLARETRRRRRRETPPSDPPQQPRAAPDRYGRSSARRNDDAERRYAVPR